MRVFALIAVLILVAGCDDDGVRLTEEDIADLFENGRTVGFQSTRFTGTATFRKDGSAKLTVPRLGTDVGKWWSDGDQLCSQWVTALRRKPVCARIERFPDGSYAALDLVGGFKLGTFELLAYDD